MGDPTQPVSTELTLRPASAAIMTPEQYDAVWSMSKALAHSGSFKDIGREEGSKALARILLGADLGMSPTQALMGIDIVKGNPQIRGVALGRMVRQSAKKPTPTGESYDYGVLDRGFNPGQEYAIVALYRRDEDGDWPLVPEGESVTFPTIVGPIVIESKSGRKPERYPEAVEAFKLDQAKKRKLVKLDGAWETQPEVMVVWRALSQIVRFHAPDVIGGMSVYTEADGISNPPTVGQGNGSGEGPGWGDMAPEQVNAAEALIARAHSLGHPGLADVPTMQQVLNGQPAEVVARRLAEFTATLDGIEAKIRDAEVVNTDDHARDGATNDTLTAAPADEFSLTFGGEVFTFNDNDDPYGMIAAALAEGVEAMEATAISLGAVGAQMRETGALIDANWYAKMAKALHAEAQERRDPPVDGADE